MIRLTPQYTDIPQPNFEDPASVKAYMDAYLTRLQQQFLACSMDYWVLTRTITDLCDTLEKRIATMDQRVVRPDKREIAQARKWAKEFQERSEAIVTRLVPSRS